MAEVPAESTQIESDLDLWSRLRESMERLANVGQRKTDPAALGEKLAARAKQLRGSTTTNKPREVPIVFLAFNKGSQRFGVPIDEVIEVQSLDHISPVPGTPSFIAGVIHWRGDVLTLLDLGKLFDIPESGLADLHVCLIVEAAGRRVAVVASEIEEIFAVPESEVKPAPDLPGKMPTEWLLGVHDNNRMIVNLELILQDARLVEWRKE